MRLDQQPPTAAETKARFQSAARLTKAVALTQALRMVGATPDDLDPAKVGAELVEQIWAQATAAANVHPPSSETKALVLQALAELNAGEASDPFEDL